LRCLSALGAPSLPIIARDCILVTCKGMSIARILRLDNLVADTVTPEIKAVPVLLLAHDAQYQNTSA
jgi:hypothetical protein